MGTGVTFDLRHGSRLREFAHLPQYWIIGLFAMLLAGQAFGFYVLGTGRWGLGLALSILIFVSLLALGCAWGAFRRAQGVAALFWFLFVAVLVVLLIPTAFQTYDTLFDKTTLSASTWRLLYCLYGAPILMMLFLPETYGRVRVKSEIFLDLFQVAIVVSLIYSTFFFLPAQRMMPAEALLHNITISDAQSLLLLVATLVRLQFARGHGTRILLARLALFLMVCAVATFIGDWIDLHHYFTASAWFTLGWTIPQCVAALIALTWTPAAEPAAALDPVNFASFLGTNLVLVAMLSCNAWLTDHWKQAYGEFLIDLAITASLFAFTLRLALTQFHQQQEIARRKAAQLQLTASHEEVPACLTTPATKLQKSPRSANSAACFTPALRATKYFVSFQSACAACFPAPRAAFHFLALPRSVSNPPPNGESVPPIRFIRPNSVGLCVAEVRTLIPADDLNHVALTCSERARRFAFRLLPMARPSEPYPSRMTIH